MVLYICDNIKEVPYINDLLKRTQNLKILKNFSIILKIVTELYNKVVDKQVKDRKNKEKAKMTDSEIISIYLLIECKGKSINSGYSILKSDFPNLVNYVEHSRFNRLINSLMSVIHAIRCEFIN